MRVIQIAHRIVCDVHFTQQLIGYNKIRKRQDRIPDHSLGTSGEVYYNLKN